MVEKMNNEQISRIKEMEENLDAAAEVIRKLSDALAEYEEIQTRYLALEDYYGSSLWMEDFEDDEAGKLPDDLKRGVLSEDAVYDLLTEHKELLTRMQRVILKAMENELH